MNSKTRWKYIFCVLHNGESENEVLFMDTEMAQVVAIPPHGRPGGPVYPILVQLIPSLLIILQCQEPIHSETMVSISVSSISTKCVKLVIRDLKLHRAMSSTFVKIRQSEDHVIFLKGIPLHLNIVFIWKEPWALIQYKDVILPV